MEAITTGRSSPCTSGPSGRAEVRRRPEPRHCSCAEDGLWVEDLGGRWRPRQSIDGTVRYLEQQLLSRALTQTITELEACRRAWCPHAGQERHGGKPCRAAIMTTILAFALWPERVLSRARAMPDLAAAHGIVDLIAAAARTSTTSSRSGRARDLSIFLRPLRDLANGRSVGLRFVPATLMRSPRSLPLPRSRVVERAERPRLRGKPRSGPLVLARRAGKIEKIDGARRAGSGRQGAGKPRCQGCAQGACSRRQWRTAAFGGAEDGRHANARAARASLQAAGRSARKRRVVLFYDLRREFDRSSMNSRLNPGPALRSSA